MKSTLIRLLLVIIFYLINTMLVHYGDAILIAFVLAWIFEGLFMENVK